MIVIPLLSFGGSLLINGWPTLLTKLAPPGQRAAYFSSISLATTPVPILISALGIVLIKQIGYNPTLFIGSAGAFCAAYLFWRKVPDIRQAPRA
jgi:predicted MFS family arabinose efflux permease